MKNFILIFILFISSFLFGQEVLTPYKIEAGQKITSIHISAFSKDSKSIIGKIQSIRGTMITLSVAENTEYRVTLNNDILFTIPPMTIEVLTVETPKIHYLTELTNPSDPQVENHEVKNEEKIEVKTEEKIEEVTEVKAEEKVEDKTEVQIEEKLEEKPVEVIDKKIEEPIEVKTKKKKKSGKKKLSKNH